MSEKRRQNGEEGEFIIIRNSSGTQLHTVSLDSLNFTRGRTKKILATPLTKPTGLGISQLPDLPVSSCNGLILIPHYERNRIWVVWNPFTGEFIEIPPHDIPSEGAGMPGCGLGYDSVSDDYKVVRISRLSGTRSETLVYSLKSDSWRRIRDFPGSVDWFRGMVPGFYLNGALHWMIDNKQGDKQIVALDLGSENYRVMPLPQNIRSKSGLSFDVLGGYLFVSFCNSEENLHSFRIECLHSLDGWIMNKYGENDSWTKLFSFAKSPMGSEMGLLRPVAYLKSKGMVLIQHDGENFFWFNVETQTAKKVKIKGIPSYFSSQVFPENPVRFNSIGGGEVASSKKRKRTDKLELKLTFSDASRPLNPEFNDW